jgi:hypothetical protein
MIGMDAKADYTAGHNLSFESNTGAHPLPSVCWLTSLGAVVWINVETKGGDAQLTRIV